MLRHALRCAVRPARRCDVLWCTIARQQSMPDCPARVDQPAFSRHLTPPSQASFFLPPPLPARLPPNAAPLTIPESLIPWDYYTVATQLPLPQVELLLTLEEFCSEDGVFEGTGHGKPFTDIFPQVDGRDEGAGRWGGGGGCDWHGLAGYRLHRWCT